MSPEQAQSIAVIIGAIVAAVTGIGALAVSIWSARRSAKKDDLDALRVIIDAQGKTIAELRAEIERKEKRIEELESEVFELRGGKPRRHTGELRTIL
jgi:predicted RNase H-like nuclease (RuvC/YqgF family)